MLFLLRQDTDATSEHADYQDLLPTDDEDASNAPVESYRKQLKEIRNTLRYNDLMGFLPDGVRTKDTADLQTFGHTQRVLHFMKGEHLLRNLLTDDNNEPADSFHHSDLTDPYPLSLEGQEPAVTTKLKQFRKTDLQPFKRFSGGLFDVAKQRQVAHLVQFIRNYFATIQSAHCLQANVIADHDPSRLHYYLANVMTFHTIPNAIVALLIYGTKIKSNRSF
ncbi:hypothetical protein H4R34_006198, partial [Dimargaris verticillata]